MMNQGFEQIQEKKEDGIPSCNLGHRMIAFIIDILCVFIFSSVLTSFAAPAIRNRFYNQDALVEKYENRIIESGLYVESSAENGKKAYYPLNMHPDYANKELNEEEQSTYIRILETGVNNFATSTSFTCFTEDDLKELQKANEKVFVYNEETKKYEIKENALKSDIIAFYQSAVQSEINTLSKDEIIKTTYAQIMRPRYIETIVSISIVAIIFLLVIPLCTKYRQTLGKKFMRLTVVRNEEIISRPMTLLRFTILFLVELLGSIFAYGIPLIISLTIACFSKNKSSLHDLLLKTKVVSIDALPSPKEEGEAEVLLPKEPMLVEVSEVKQEIEDETKAEIIEENEKLNEDSSKGEEE